MSYGAPSGGGFLLYFTVVHMSKETGVTIAPQDELNWDEASMRWCGWMLPLRAAVGATSAITQLTRVYDTTNTQLGTRFARGIADSK